MSNYIVDGSDLTSVANAIRARSGGSSQLAFPSGFVSEIQSIPSGGSSNNPLVIRNYVIPDAKWTSKNSFPNVLKTGGCVHCKYTEQINSSTSNDLAMLCFGVGALSAWSPGTSNPSAYWLTGKNGSNSWITLRGVGNVSFGFANARHNGVVDIKLYANKYVDVLTGTEYSYSTSVQQFFTALANANYISVGVNQSNPFAGAVITYFGLEES